MYHHWNILQSYVQYDNLSILHVILHCVGLIFRMYTVVHNFHIAQLIDMWNSSGVTRSRHVNLLSNSTLAPKILPQHCFKGGGDQ